MKEKEVRQLTTEKIEIRSVSEGQKKTIGGYAVKYNSPTLMRDRWEMNFLKK